MQDFCEVPTAKCQMPFNLRLNGKRLPFTGLVLAAMIGILMGEFFQEPSWSLILGIIVTFGGWLFLRRWRLFFCFLFVVLFFGIIHTWQSKESPARRLALLINNITNTVLVKGLVASEVKRSGKNQVTFFIKTRELEWNSMKLMPRVMMLVHWEGTVPNYGDLISLRATGQPPSLPKNPGEFNKLTWLARQGVYTELKMDPSEPGTIISSGHGFFVKRWAIAWRERAEKILESGIESDQVVVSLIKGIVVGVKGNEALLDDFKLTGTMHLFAVSGLHVGMVMMMIWFFLKLLRLSTRAAVPLTLLFLFGYVIVTGCHIGSLRAALMATIVLVGFLLDRRPQLLNNLAAAAFVLLLFDTNLLFSMGWQFSFSVVLAIVLLTSSLEKYFGKYVEFDPFIPKQLMTRWQKRYQCIGKHVTQLIAVSIAAWVGALVPTAYYFHQISFSALGANIIAVPLAFLIMLTSLLSIGIGLITLSAAIIFNNANWIFIKLLIFVVHGFALLPWSTCSIALTPLHPRLTIFDFPDAQAIVLQSEGKTWMINAARAMQAAKTLVPFLEQTGVSRLEGLLLTQTDAGSSGGATLLLEKEKPHFVFAPSNAQRALQFRHFEKACQASHQDCRMLSKRLDFSKECWGEFIAPSQMAPFAFKLHCKEKSLLSIPNPAVAEWLMKQASEEFFSADVLYFSWRPKNFLKYEPLFAKIKPRIFILPETFSQPGPINYEEEEMLKRYRIKLLPQEETGAITIDCFSNDQTLKVTGWKESLTKSSFQCK